MSYDDSKVDGEGYLSIVVVDFKESFQFKDLRDACQFVEHAKGIPESHSINFNIQHFKPDAKNAKFLEEAKKRMGK